MIGSLQSGLASMTTAQPSAPTADGGCVCANLLGNMPAEVASVKGGETLLTGSDATCVCASCTPAGTVAFDSGVIPSVVAIASDGIGAPTYGVYVLPIGNLPCPSYKMTITADLQWTGTPNTEAAAAHAYLAAAGANLSGRGFVPGNTPTQLANIPADSDGLYDTYTWVVFPGGSPAFELFTGPLLNQSLYLWPPVLGPDFVEGFWNVKNLHVVIVTQ